MNLSLGFSPCPNDTFIFYAMINDKVDTEGLTFEVFMEDVAELNQKAFQKTLDITKLSYHAYAYLIEDYVLLNAGSALGNNCGPLLIAKQPLEIEALEQGKVVIPGKYTTANFLLSLAYPTVKDKTAVLFSEIETAVLEEQASAGLIIHENRFTYEAKGLIKIRDLGEYWEETYQMPIPLGGIVIKRNLPLNVQQKVDRVLRRSVEYAFAHPAETMPFVSDHAQEMEQSVMQQHIDLYVNNYTIDLGEKGRAAVQTLFDVAKSRAIIPASDQEIFVKHSSQY